MNQAASAPGSNLIPDWTGIITTGHLVLVAVLAVLVVIGVIWGARLARQRKAAEREVAAHNAEIEEAQPERRSGVDRRQTPWPPEDDEPPLRAISPEAAAAPTVLIFDKIPDVAPEITATPAVEPAGGSNLSAVMGITERVFSLMATRMSPPIICAAGGGVSVTKNCIGVPRNP